ncbi:MAG: hypothetical protein AB1Z23_11000 [Eubacteriales bacterium]
MQESKNTILSTEEEILWQGKPKNKIFDAIDAVLLPANILGLGVICYIFFIVLPQFNMDLPIFFNIFYGLFIAIMAYIAFGRYFVKSFVQQRTEYFLTNKRSIIVRNFKRKKIISTEYKFIYNVKKKTNTDGTCKIVFGNSGPVGFLYENTFMYPSFLIKGIQPMGFYNIDSKDVAEIESIVSPIIK